MSEDELMFSEDEDVSSGRDPQSQLPTPAAADKLLHLNRLAGH